MAKKDPTVILWHTTSPEAAQDITQEGFQGGWGDVGFGVYLYDNMADAVAYGERGGWDSKLPQFAVLEVEVPYSIVEGIDPHPDWPNPEDYQTVRFVPMDEDHEDDFLVLPTVVVAVGARKRKR